MKGLFYIRGTNVQIMLRVGGVLQNTFSSNIDTKSEFLFQP